MLFSSKNEISPVGLNILKKRYFAKGETEWKEVVARVLNQVLPEGEDDSYEYFMQRQYTYEMILNRYFLPNSPCLVNSGKENPGLCACFVVGFPDDIEGIYKTKLDFARIARKGGGCGTTLSSIRPKGSPVSGSTHGYAAGPVNFFDTICHEMDILSQGGFRSMAMMGSMSCRHPDILEFITAKEQEGKMSTTNISVLVDDAFMQAVKDDTTYWTEFGGVKYQEFRARDIFNLIVEGAWRNGEPGLLFYDTMNKSPYHYSGQDLVTCNPCGEQSLPANGVCNLGSLDLCKFLSEDKSLDLQKLELATRLGIRFLNSVAERSSYPTEEIKKWASENLPVGLGIMGLADYYLVRGIAYGSPEALEELRFILQFMYTIAEDESIILGEKRGIPEACKFLPVPRRNITLLSIAPTGTISLIAGANSGIEPIFSEITIRNDKTGQYTLNNVSADADYFRCAVSATGSREVTWEEHVRTQAAAQEFVDSGVSKTINFPNHTHRDTIAKSFMLAWELGCKGITVYRNGSRKVEVLSPKNLKKDKCPLCESDLLIINDVKKCSKCDWSLKEE